MSIRKYFAAFALLSCASAAVAKDEVYSITPNDLTVSGRFQLPRNDETGALQNLVVSDIEYPPSLLANLITNDELFRSSFRTALEKSLSNFGYNITTVNSSAATRIALTGLDIKPTDSGYTTELTIIMSYSTDRLKSGDTLPAMCLPVTAKGQYRINRAKKSSGGQRALIGVGSLFGVSDLDRLATAPKDTSAAAETAGDTPRHNSAEGTFDAKNDVFLVRYGLINATQLAIADLIFQLKQSCGNSAK